MGQEQTRIDPDVTSIDSRRSDPNPMNPTDPMNHTPRRAGDRVETPPVKSAAVTHPGVTPASAGAASFRLSAPPPLHPRPAPDACNPGSLSYSGERDNFQTWGVRHGGNPPDGKAQIGTRRRP